MDRRIQKSKQAILDAFVELMARKEFEKITINEIAEYANVNRGTVYLHYADKYDLLDQCIETSLTQLTKYCSEEAVSTNSPKASIASTFEYMEKNAFLYTTLLTAKGVPAFRNQLLKMMQQSLDEQIDMGGINQGISKDVLVNFVTSAAVGVLEWWFINSMPYSAKDITEQLWELLERNQIV